MRIELSAPPRVGYRRCPHLEGAELIKCSVLESSSLDVREAAEELAERCHAELVQVIGRRFVLYRETSREGVEKIQLV